VVNTTTQVSQFTLSTAHPHPPPKSAISCEVVFFNVPPSFTNTSSVPSSVSVALLEIAVESTVKAPEPVTSQVWVALVVLAVLRVIASFCTICSASSVDMSP